MTLVDVTRLPLDMLEVVQPGAEDGLVFLFLVVRRPGTEGKPTLRELSDFQVERTSYRDRTKEKLGAPVEPLTFLEDANAFLERVGHGAVVDPMVPSGEAYVIVATIGGARLATGDRGNLVLEIGFGGRTESLPFQFAVPAADEPDESEGDVPRAVPVEPREHHGVVGVWT